MEWDFTDPLTGVSIDVEKIHYESHPEDDDYADIVIKFPEDKALESNYNIYIRNRNWA